jgi:uncharacterized zinc-type alcohol dehydrogenase-like protein
MLRLSIHAGPLRTILPDCEVIPIQEINNAFDRLERGDIRYRFVIGMASIDGELTRSI